LKENKKNLKYFFILMTEEIKLALDKYLNLSDEVKQTNKSLRVKRNELKQYYDFISEYMSNNSLETLTEDDIVIIRSSKTTKNNIIKAEELEELLKDVVPKTKLNKLKEIIKDKEEPKETNIFKVKRKKNKKK
jgi:hypothetical protein